jgi:hypothetical protein
LLVSKKVQGGGCHGRGRHVGKREEAFIKNDMSGGDDAIRLKLETPIAFVFQGVAEKNA